MRALRHFFYGAAAEQLGFDFDIDFSQTRAAEAAGEGDVRRFLYIKVTFRTPASHADALGSEFYVKRTWSPSGYREEYSRHIERPGQKQSLTKLLSKIAFIYVPAVKGAEVYTELLEEAYNAIAGSERFSRALTAFTDEIRAQTVSLGKSLNRSLGMSSELSPPTDLEELFGTLDFQTLSGAGTPMSLLKQRGDGVQARHIPEIMAFISEKSEHQYHIWGIEEPENSLSINSSLLLADRLKEISTSSEIQLFLTTHSPAFYSLSGEGVTKRFLKSDAEGVSVLDGTSADSSQLLAFMGDRFYLPLISKEVESAKARADSLEAAVDELGGQLRDHQRPILFVEGPSDERLLSHLLERRGTPQLVDVISLDSANHAERFGGMTESLIKRLLRERRGFVLLDSDQEGRKSIPRSIDRTAAMRGWLNSANSLSWRLLPLTDEAEAAYAAAGVRAPEHRSAILEDCYDAATRRRAMDAGAYGLAGPRPSAHQMDLLVISDALRDEAHRFYLLSPQDNLKGRFVEWLIDTHQAECAVLTRLLDEVQQALAA